MSRAASFAAISAVPAVLSLALLGGCARYILEEPRGSIKDTPAASAAAAGKPAPRKPRVRPAAESAEPRVPATAGMPAAPAAPAGRPAGPAPIAVGPAPITVPAEGSPRENGGGATTGPASEQAQAEVSKRLLAEGDRLFQAGDVVKARERYLAAMNGPIPEVMLAFARSFDPYYLARLPRSNAAPDAQRAVTIYEGAVRQGAKDAEADLQRLRKSLSTSPAGTPIRPVQPPSRPATDAPPAAAAPPAQAPPAEEPAAKQ